MWRHSRGVKLPWPFLGLLLVCCAGSAQHVVGTPVAKPQPAVGALAPAPRPNNTLYRDEVVDAIHAGLGHFFQMAELEPSGDLDPSGKMISFHGYQIVVLRPASSWLPFDFAPGDIVTHINGVTVEHYSNWYDQFEALSKADQIRVDLMRDGQSKAVIVKIIERSKATGHAAASN
jgi:S1-C subfamily serine protease